MTDRVAALIDRLLVREGGYVDHAADRGGPTKYGITQANADQMKTSDNPQVGRLLGATEDLGKHLGLDKEWLYRAIKVTGNYGEMFERNVGPKTSINLPRGMNRQWSQGGLQYAAPLR